jgi:sulfonate transport system permease protein
MNRKLTNWTLGIGTPLLLVAAWGVFSQGSTNTFFPPLGMILERFQALWLFEHFGSDVMLSLRNLVIGYVLATVIGVGLGFVTALVPVVRWALDPLIHFIRGIPPVAPVP